MAAAGSSSDAVCRSARGVSRPNPGRASTRPGPGDGVTWDARIVKEVRRRSLRAGPAVGPPRSALLSAPISLRFTRLPSQASA